MGVCASGPKEERGRRRGSSDFALETLTPDQRQSYKRRLPRQRSVSDPEVRHVFEKHSSKVVHTHSASELPKSMISHNSMENHYAVSPMPLSAPSSPQLANSFSQPLYHPQPTPGLPYGAAPVIAPSPYSVVPIPGFPAMSLNPMNVAQPQMNPYGYPQQMMMPNMYALDLAHPAAPQVHGGMSSQVVHPQYMRQRSRSLDDTKKRGKRKGNSMDLFNALEDPYVVANSAAQPGGFVSTPGFHRAPTGHMDDRSSPSDSALPPMNPQLGHYASVMYQPESGCISFAIAKEFIAQLGVPDDFFDPNYNSCFCDCCYPAQAPKLFTRGDPPLKYGLPVGWVRFGLDVTDKFKKADIWNKWNVSFHGVPNPRIAVSVLREGDLKFPGDKLSDGSILKIQDGHIAGENYVFTSPSVIYASYYATSFPVNMPRFRHIKSGQITFQIRQKPGTFVVQSETLGMSVRGQLIDPSFDNEEIEFKTKERNAVALYGLCIKLSTAQIPPDMLKKLQL